MMCGGQREEDEEDCAELNGQRKCKIAAVLEATAIMTRKCKIAAVLKATAIMTTPVRTSRGRIVCRVRRA